MMRLPLSDLQEAARSRALRLYQHKQAVIGEMARATNCLPIYIDWTAFLGLGARGDCVWVDYEESPGKVEAVTELQHLSILAANAPRVPGLEGVAPSRPPGREDCSQCKGTGHLLVGAVEVGCICGGLGWRAASAEELGVQAS